MLCMSVIRVKDMPLLQIYNPSKNSWASSVTAGPAIQPFPAARGGMGKAVYFNGEFYCFGMHLLC